MKRSALPFTSADVAIALDAADGEADRFLRVMRNAYPRFGLVFAHGGTA